MATKEEFQRELMETGSEFSGREAADDRVAELYHFVGVLLTLSRKPNPPSNS